MLGRSVHRESAQHCIVAPSLASRCEGSVRRGAEEALPVQHFGFGEREALREIQGDWRLVPAPGEGHHVRLGPGVSKSCDQVSRHPMAPKGTTTANRPVRDFTVYIICRMDVAV